MSFFEERGIQYVHHYAPLHYLPFIARTGALLSKVALRQEGFSDAHFRSTSSRQDVTRGFDNFVHLALEQLPPIAAAKLDRGFPHIEFDIPTALLDASGFHLCRYNIAKCRYFRGAKAAPPESPANGRYYGEIRVPIAVTEREKHDLFAANFGRCQMEVLVPGALILDGGVRLSVFSDDDALLASEVIEITGAPWKIERADHSYDANRQYAASVREFLTMALENPAWRGNGLEYDRV